jgi:hypothetical protein
MILTCFSGLAMLNLWLDSLIFIIWVTLQMGWDPNYIHTHPSLEYIINKSTPIHSTVCYIHTTPNRDAFSANNKPNYGSLTDYNLFENHLQSKSSLLVFCVSGLMRVDEVLYQVQGYRLIALRRQPRRAPTPGDAQTATCRPAMLARGVACLVSR